LLFFALCHHFHNLAYGTPDLLGLVGREVCLD
jgi:hypothetical protein